MSPLEYIYIYNLLYYYYYYCNGLTRLSPGNPWEPTGTRSVSQFPSAPFFVDQGTLGNWSRYWKEGPTLGPPKPRRGVGGGGAGTVWDRMGLPEAVAAVLGLRWTHPMPLPPVRTAEAGCGAPRASPTGTGGRGERRERGEAGGFGFITEGFESGAAHSGADGVGDGSLPGPPGPQALVNDVVRHPDGRALGFEGLRVETPLSAVCSLLDRRRPPAISGLVSPGVVDSVECHAVWALTHCRSKRGKRSPLRAN